MEIKKNKLTPEEKRVIIDKGTEPPFTEHLTPKNARHCVNSISMKFIPD